MFTPGLPNPLDDEAEKARRLDRREFGPSRYWRWVLIGGLLVLLAFALLALVGWTGSGVVLVPIGLCMVIGAAIQLLLDRL
jgi:fatty acid desaturase